MRRTTVAWSLVATLSLAAFACTSQPVGPSETSGAVAASSAAKATPAGRRFSGGAVYVTSQGLYYDTFVARDPLPMEGTFQRLVNGTTEFGPGDPGYLGGRWWEDLNGNGVQDEDDHFFECPLLPPGRPTP